MAATGGIRAAAGPGFVGPRSESLTMMAYAASNAAVPGAHGGGGGGGGGGSEPLPPRASPNDSSFAHSTINGLDDPSDEGLGLGLSAWDPPLVGHGGGSSGGHQHGAYQPRRSFDDRGGY